MVIVGGLANMFFALPALQLTLIVLSFAIFSVFLVVDLNRIVKGGETNYVTATLSVYLDLYNMFVQLLQLIMIFTGNRDD